MKLLFIGAKLTTLTIAEVPELSGCSADGETYAQALSNVEYAIAEWIETANELGRPIPVPADHLHYG